MIRGIGLDLCETARMERLLRDERFLRRFFTEGEIAYIAGRKAQGAQTMAGIFAAKEAFGKALGTGIAFDLREAEVIHGEGGEPRYALSGRAAELAGKSRAHLSISHDGGIAGAVCLLEAEDGEEAE